MKVYFFESKCGTEYNKFLRTDIVRIDLCFGAPMYDYSVGHIEATLVAADNTDAQNKLREFLVEASKLYGRIVLGEKTIVKPLRSSTV